MTLFIAFFTFLVRDYDEAIAWFTERLGFRLLEDAPVSAPKRWVRVGPRGDRPGAALLLGRAATPEQEARVGRQGGGRVTGWVPLFPCGPHGECRWRGAGPIAARRD